MTQAARPRKKTGPKPRKKVAVPAPAAPPPQAPTEVEPRAEDRFILLVTEGKLPDVDYLNNQVGKGHKIVSLERTIGLHDAIQWVAVIDRGSD